MGCELEFLFYGLEFITLVIGTEATPKPRYSAALILFFPNSPYSNLAWFGEEDVSHGHAGVARADSRALK